MSGLRRVIVGASGSPGNLCALRYAEHLARATGATLIPVHAWIPPGGDLADRRCPSLYLRRVWTEDARQRLAESLQAAWGQPPADLTIDPVVARGEPGPVLTAIACQPGDDPGHRHWPTRDAGPPVLRPGQPLLPGPRPRPFGGHPTTHTGYPSRT